MTKPWEETWEKLGQRVCLERRTESLSVGTSLGKFEYALDGDDCVGRARLAAAAPEMARLLWELAESDAMCPACGVSDNDPGAMLDSGHNPACKIVAILQKAGVFDDMFDTPAMLRVRQARSCW